MSLSPNLCEPDDKLVASAVGKDVYWSRTILKPPRPKGWKVECKGETWIDHRAFGSVGFNENGPDGKAVYIVTAAPVFVTADGEKIIAWPGIKNWINVDAAPTPAGVTTERPELPVFKEPVAAWTFFAEHFCWTKVALFEVQHGGSTAYVPVAKLSSGKFAIRPQDRLDTFEAATKIIFDLLAPFFVVTEPTVFLDAKGQRVPDRHVDLQKFWEMPPSYRRICPFEHIPTIFTWENSNWVRSKTLILVEQPKTLVKNNTASVTVTIIIPHGLTVRSVRMAVCENVYFNRNSPFAGIQSFKKPTFISCCERKIHVTLNLSMAQYASSFVSLNSNPWAFVPLHLQFKEHCANVLVLGAATPRYVRGDIKEATLHAGAPSANKFYYKVPHKNMAPGMVELARYIEEESREVYALVKTKKPRDNYERLRPGELLIFLRYLIGLKTWFVRRNTHFSVPVYPRTSIIYNVPPGSFDVMSIDAKRDRCAILTTPLWI